jgi:predicted O-methyltransferase YrrM
VTKKLWTAVDQYISTMLIPCDPVLDEAVRTAAEAGLPQIQVSPPQGKFLHILVRSLAASRLLEIGTLGGYSAIWMARALPPGGHLLTLEAESKHAEVARANFARAGLTACIEVRLGPALDTLPRIAAEGRGPFDLIFIDANKSAITEYFDWALRLSRPGSVILVDNVIRDGDVINADSDDPDVKGVRRFNVRLAEESRVSATEIQTVGSKGYDGFAMAVVLAD